MAYWALVQKCTGCCCSQAPPQPARWPDRRQKGPILSTSKNTPVCTSQSGGLGWGASFWSALHDPDICKVDGVSEGDSKALMSSWVEVKGRGALALGWDQPDPDYPQT